MADQQNPAQMVAKQQSLDAANEYKSGWDSAPETGGLGQFPVTPTQSGPFTGQPGGLTTAASSAMTQAAAAPLPGMPATPAAAAPVAPTAAPAAPTPVGPAVVDALPETMAGAVTNDTPDGINVQQNATTNPYVGSTNAESDVGRQETRPERMAIDDTMSADEQYRRQWINESNGYYGLDVAKVAPPPAPAAAPVEEAAPPAPIEYGVSYNGQTDASDGMASVYDKATGQVVQTFQGTDLFNRLGGVGAVNSDKLKEYTGWSAPVAAPAPAPKETA